MKLQEIHEIVRDDLKGTLEHITRIYTPDREYVTLSNEKMQQILKETAPNRPEASDYIKEVFDCDDFALIMHAEVVKWARDNDYKKPLAFGQVWGSIQVQGEWVNHAINWFITPTKQIMFLEPQLDKVFAPEHNIQEAYFLRI